MIAFAFSSGDPSRAFDVSPYFAIVKPTLESAFDHRQFSWHDSAVPTNA